ncbi:Cystathionine gamma-synthase/O-acetylhomoserine (thiol)-lyase [Avibacterium paragallinarum]|uniref:Cystathionine gamma-synthase/O-acetylhomoserine (Thiol)-lyase n=1 Tax=Avibacterium paragallinarum TaxID=728 RepID=A0A380XA28_AVIPA|nr:Cystathionine gamma-synthase/O-acetylhomoserine (thiol)-lyase [Avibacterium paragallinarum]
MQHIFSRPPLNLFKDKIYFKALSLYAKMKLISIRAFYFIEIKSAVSFFVFFEDFMTQQYHIETLLAQAGNRTDERTGAVSTPIFLSTAYGHHGIGESTGFDYTRTKNPTRTVLEETIAKLEGGERGFACASGMASIQLIMQLFASPMNGLYRAMYMVVLIVYWILLIKIPTE